MIDSVTVKNTYMNKCLQGVRAVWFIFIVIIFISFLYSIPGTYRMLMTVCELPADQCASWAQLTPQSLAILTNLHISLQAFAIFHTLLYTSVSLIFWASGLLVLRFRSNDWHGLVVSYLLITLGAAGVSMVLQSGLGYVAVPEILDIVSGIIVIPLYLALSLFFQTFPDGKIYPRWVVLGTVLIIANYAAWLAPGQFNIENWPPVLMGIWLLCVFGFHIFIIQGVRYRYYYSQEQRQQTKWLIYGAGISLVISVCSGWFVDPKIGDLIEGIIVALGFYLPITLAVMIAILRYRLWDIDIIINRTLVYSGLTAITVAIYVGIVTALSAIFQTSGNLIVSLIATGFVVVIFQPLREHLQNIINRFVFGERNNPYAVISRLSEQLEHHVSPRTLLPGIVEMISETLKLSYVAVTLKDGDKFKTDAVYGQPIDKGRITKIDLLYGEDVVGQLIIGQDAGDKLLSTSERQLLENIARQTGIAAHAVQLSAALQQSRQQIITAREEERRRLRRDLHDGIGPALAAHTIKVGAARALLETDPQTASIILSELETNLSNSLMDIRRLVYNLRPPALDQLGLIGALNDFILQCNGQIAFVFDTPDDEILLSAATEVAAYRIVQEAINNVIRHSQARHSWISIAWLDDLCISIRDDGIGLATDLRFGVGLNAIQERTEELGGDFTISSSPQNGTELLVRLPL